MPTFQNDGTKNVQYRPVTGGNLQLLEPGETCQSYEMLHILHPNVTKTSDAPRSDRVMQFDEIVWTAGGGSTTITLTQEQVLSAERIEVSAIGTSLVITISVNGKLWRKLNVNAGITGAVIRAKRDIETITLEANTVGRAYVYIERDYR